MHNFECKFCKKHVATNVELDRHIEQEHIQITNIETVDDRDINVEDHLPSLMYPVPELDDGLNTEPVRSSVHEVPEPPIPSVELSRSVVYATAAPPAQCQVPQPFNVPMVQVPVNANLLNTNSSVGITPQTVCPARREIKMPAR